MKLRSAAIILVSPALFGVRLVFGVYTVGIVACLDIVGMGDMEIGKSVVWFPLATAAILVGSAWVITKLTLLK